MLLILAASGCFLLPPDDGTDYGPITLGEQPNEPGPDTPGPVDSGTYPTTPTGEPALNGEVPPQVLGIPDFVATNRDGTPRGPEHLRGSITVMWFYPAAFTGG